jgi:putative ABC transport system ATP-binding protein
VTARPTARGVELIRHGATPAPRGGAPAARRSPAAGGVRPGVTVEVRGLRKAQGGQLVLRGLSHAFAPGRLHVVAGPSGSGKTTLLDLVCGLERPDGGELLVDGEPLALAHPDALAAWRRSQLGHVSQHATLTDALTAAENVALALSLRGRRWPDALAAAERWLERLGLERVRDRRARRLSGGEQRRVALARALVGEPPLLVVDEPTAHLDRSNGRHVLALLEQAAHEHGLTVIASSHDPDAIDAADELLELGG